ncbi:hypothetical protein [Spiroplasma melliferum]|uniref:Uncharacterized protein n=2 Tax=Spiroplasma melliferum TaxID=2134 RepID=A0AAI9X1S7_SPIME|nr:hypothetical protein [Spiroplasma melliferum]KAI93160.1 hypothetical protein SPM_002835 [Spiroplasma melliferum KC3]QCO23897.1 hypothetical protein SRED_002377 [Spiroplasma melliferum]
MIKLIRLLTGALQDTAVGELLKKGLEQYGLIKKEASQFKKLYNWTDPRKILQYLKVASKKEINSLLDKIEKRSLQQGKDLFNEQYKDSKEWVQLQSSWMKYGKFELTNKITNTGSATFLFQPKAKVYGPYTYPSMPADVWLALKNANSNAGTLFWRIWLRVWLPSMIRRHIKLGLITDKNIRHGKKSDTFIQALVVSPKEVNDVRKYIRKLEQGFYHNIGHDKRRSVKQIGTYKWKRNQAQQFRNKRRDFINKYSKINEPIQFAKTIRNTQSLLKQFVKTTKKIQKEIKFVRRTR